ncbi:MAG: hypothetical protein JWP36_116 [Paucimonas sp.]|nr:hypothetical protein [Paucimonas sp.]
MATTIPSSTSTTQHTCPNPVQSRAAQTHTWMHLLTSTCPSVNQRAPGQPLTPRPLNQAQARATAMPRLTTMQQQGSLPPPCRGGDCQVDEFLRAASDRFVVSYQGLPGNAKLNGKHVVILLPSKDEQALADVKQLLKHHGDFTGRSGKVLMTDHARNWLGNPLGVQSVGAQAATSDRINRHKVGHLITRVIELAIQHQLGEVGQTSWTLYDGIAQLKRWKASAQHLGKPEVAAKLGQALQEFMQLRGPLHNQALGLEITPLLQELGRVPPATGLSISVVTGEDGLLLGAEKRASLQGMIMVPASLSAPAPGVAPSAGQVAAKLTAVFRSQVDMTTLEGGALDGRRSLAGTVVLAGFQGEANVMEYANILLAAALHGEPGRGVGVTVYQTGVSVPLPGASQQAVRLQDESAATFEGFSKATERARARLLALVRRDAPPGMIDILDTPAVTPDKFLSMVEARLQASSSPETRREGKAALEHYRQVKAGLTALNTARVYSWLNQLDSHAEALAREGRVGLLSMPVDLLELTLSLTSEFPQLAMFYGKHIVVARVPEPVRDHGPSNTASGGESREM